MGAYKIVKHLNISKQLTNCSVFGLKFTALS